jgi:hypothetical protein
MDFYAAVLDWSYTTLGARKLAEVPPSTASPVSLTIEVRLPDLSTSSNASCGGTLART